MPVTIDTRKFDSEVTDAVMDLASYSFDREQKTFAREYNPEQMAREVETLLKQPHAGDPIRHWDPKSVASKIFTELHKLSTEAIRDTDPQGMNRYYEIRKLTQNIMDYSDTLRKSRPKTWEEAQTEAQERIDHIVKGTQQNASHVANQVSAAIHRCLSWETSPIKVVPSFNKDHWDVATSFSVKVGPHGADFTVFTKPDGTVDEVEDVLVGGDEDFFRNPISQMDYLNLVKELRSPGSSSKGKPVSLWTARPVKDRNVYEHAHTIPPSIFLTNDPDRALGLSTDLGSAARDVWHVIINSKYLVETMDSGRVKDYQVVGEHPVPVERMEMYMEAGSGRVASRYVVRCAGN